MFIGPTEHLSCNCTHTGVERKPRSQPGGKPAGERKVRFPGNAGLSGWTFENGAVEQEMNFAGQFQIQSILLLA